MGKALIKLTYKQIINSSAKAGFERNVFDATYHEFKLRARAYDTQGKFTTFTELKTNDGRADSLHYRISFAAGHLVEGLNNRMPDLVDNSGNVIMFDTAVLELIESDVNNRQAHKLAIYYTTGSLILCDTVSDYLILAKQELLPNCAANTFMVRLQPNLSITEYQLQEQCIRSAFVPMLKQNN